MYLLSEHHQLVDDYNSLWTLADPRVDGRMFMSNATGVACVVIAYIWFVIFVPKFMHQQRQLKWIIFVYNICLIALNFHIFKELLIVMFNKKYNIFCEGVRQSTDPDEMRGIDAFYLFFLSKIIELLDTVFIVLRKKSEQLTLIHVYHHSTMIPVMWIGVRWFPGGLCFAAAALNSFVHICMYTYYGLTILGPAVTKYIWWKKYLTMLQMVQFCIILLWVINIIIIKCPFPIWGLYFFLLFMLSHLILFGLFYINTYIVKKASKLETAFHQSYNLEI